MIFVVDNEKGDLEAVKFSLEEEGYEVATFDGAESALGLVGTLGEPEMIISEVDMPGMNGIAFKKEYSRLYPNSLAPFVFYSRLGQPRDLMAGLAVGADDYMVKYLTPEVLRLKLRSILTRKFRYLYHTFYGDVAKLPFFKLMQFCETKGLTGEVEVQSRDMGVIMSFKGGQMQSDKANDEILLQVYDLSEGTFIIRAVPIDFTEIGDAAAVGSELAAKAATTVQEVYTEKEKPMGKLGGVQVDKRLFQVQTEFVMKPSNQIQTLVILDGRVVHKKIIPVTEGKVPKRELEKLIEKQHFEVEADIRERLTAVARSKKGEPAETPQDRFGALFEEGFEKYRNEDYPGALSAWEQAYAINPTDQSLETNIRILKKKLNLPG